MLHNLIFHLETNIVFNFVKKIILCNSPTESLKQNKKDLKAIYQINIIRLKFRIKRSKCQYKVYAAFSRYDKAHFNLWCVIYGYIRTTRFKFYLLKKTGSVKSTSVTQFYDSMYLITKCLHFHYETDTVQRKDNIWQKLGRGWHAPALWYKSYRKRKSL